MEDLNNSISKDAEGNSPKTDVNTEVKEGTAGADKGTEEKDKGKVTPRVFTEDEWRKRESAKDKEISRVRSDFEKRQSDLEARLQAAQEASDRAAESAFLRQIEESGGDVDAAKLVLKRHQEVANKEREYARKEAELRKRELIIAEASRGQFAHDLLKQYELTEDSLTDLMEADTPEKMENAALKLAIQKSKTPVKPPTSVESPIGDKSNKDITKIPETVRLGSLMEQSFKK